MYYTVFASASLAHIDWLRAQIRQLTNISGHVTRAGIKGGVYQLKYAKAESNILLARMYPPNKKILALRRKKLKINAMLRIISGSGE
jgi:hypothetical protein